MRVSKQMMLGCAAALAAAALPALAQPPAAPPKALLAYTPKPTRLPAYGSNKPVTRLSEVLAKHKGQASWTEQVIKTDRFDTRWAQMAPGEKLSTRYYGDDRVMWVVWQGQIRFNIEGQEPFVASKGFLVQVPQRVRYSMETVGNEPSLRYEVTRAGQHPNFPADNGEPKPPNAPDGTEYVKISTPTQPDKYEGVNKPYVDFLKDVVAKDPVKGPSPSLVMMDEGNMSNIIRGKGIPTPPPTNKGHFHVGRDEFWFILEGKIEHLIEDIGLVSSDAGDIVFVPPGRWHRATFADGQTDTRLSFNANPYTFHAFAPNSGGEQ
jgi:mannose-6-phosphate isomerase-like protein (cupin superfamily)